MHHLPFAFGLPHGMEWAWILIIVVLLFGADKLPKLARGLGKSLGEFKKAKEEFDKEIHSAANAEDTKSLPQTSAPATALTPTTPASAVPVENGLPKKI